MNNEYTPMRSKLEIQRNAPFHYLAKAMNAHFSASLIWNLQEQNHKTLYHTVHFSGDPNIAIMEAFRRESAFSLESIIKAAVAQRIEFGIAQKHVTRVRPTHRLEDLWREAELPTLNQEDYHRLLITTQYLIWAGRYAAPNDNAKFDEDMRKIKELDIY